MEEKNSLEYYKNLNYQCFLKKKGSLFILLVPELSLLVEDENLEKAYEKLEKEKEIYFKEMIRTDYAEYIKEPAGIKLKKAFIAPFLLFLAKFFTVTLGILFIGYLAVVAISPQIGKIDDKVKAEVKRGKKNAQKFLGRFHEMPEEEKEELRQSIRSVIKDFKPFIDEFKVVFQDDTETEEK